MKFKSEKGFSAVDIAVSIILVTILIALVVNVVSSINMKSKRIDRMNIAMSYAVSEIEKIKAKGYVALDYDDKGIISQDILVDEDINDSDDVFTGYHKKILVDDYVLLKNDNSKKSDIVKKVTVQILYKVNGNIETVELSTFLARGE